MNDTLPFFRTALILPALLLAGCAATLQQQESAPDPQALAREADSAYAQDNLAKSERLYTRLTELAPDTAVYWYRLGNIRARTGQPYAAITAYGEALQRRPDLAEAWYNMGLVQLRLAAHTFNALQDNAEPASPLSRRTRGFVDDILKLIDRGQAQQ